LAPAAELIDAHLTYPSAAGDVHALRGVSYVFHRGSKTAVVGRSGSGKSSLIAVLALLRTPTRGEVVVDGSRVRELPAKDIARLRGRKIGVVFQSFHLDAAETAAANVMLPWVFQGRASRKTARCRAHEVLEQLGIGHLGGALPHQMSGGQRQRVAIARSLFPRPRILIADEPTGNLDEETANQVAGDLYALADSHDTAVIVVTHDPDIATMATDTIQLRQGKIVTDL